MENEFEDLIYDDKDEDEHNTGQDGAAQGPGEVRGGQAQASKII